MEAQLPVLSIKEVSKSFSGVQVLKDIHLDLYPGEVHCLIGENGAGKSTLIKIISGAYQPDGGTITRDASGAPAGVFKDNARELVSRAIPPDTPEQIL